MSERDADQFSTKKKNEHGRYMRIITLNKGGRSVLIIPELALNAGWCDIALKMEEFIKVPMRQSTAAPRNN